jgi:hypothetical protein
MTFNFIKNKNSPVGDGNSTKFHLSFNPIAIAALIHALATLFGGG